MIFFSLLSIAYHLINEVENKYLFSFFKASFISFEKKHFVLCTRVKKDTSDIKEVLLNWGYFQRIKPILKLLKFRDSVVCFLGVSEISIEAI